MEGEGPPPHLTVTGPGLASQAREGERPGEHPAPGSLSLGGARWEAARSVLGRDWGGEASQTACVRCTLPTPSQAPFPGAAVQSGSHNSHGGASGSLEQDHPHLFLSPQPWRWKVATHFSGWKTEARGFPASGPQPCIIPCAQNAGGGWGVLGQVPSFREAVAFPRSSPPGGWAWPGPRWTIRCHSSQMEAAPHSPGNQLF